MTNQYTEHDIKARVICACPYCGHERPIRYRVGRTKVRKTFTCLSCECVVPIVTSIISNHGGREKYLDFCDEVLERKAERYGGRLILREVPQRVDETGST